VHLPSLPQRSHETTSTSGNCSHKPPPSAHVAIPVATTCSLKDSNFDAVVGVSCLVDNDMDEDYGEAEDDDGEEPPRYITAHVNGTSGAGTVVFAPDGMTRTEFFDAAATALGLPSMLNRMFTRSGGEIVADMDAVLDGEELWLSDGTEFFHP
jgi:hypothetical protein